MSNDLRNDIRNIAIVAHVDHGKTTLVDQMLRQTGAFRANQKVEERVMDSNDLERERGITILAKNTSIRYRDVKINIIDTPGHSDFGGEVERVLKMADGILLLVDAAEGPKPQTKFVLRKALGYDLKPLVVINKIDRPDARAHQVLDETFDLFIELGATDDQLDFRTIYASGREGYARREMKHEDDNLLPLLDAILEVIPPPRVAPGGLQVLVSNIDYNDYVGRIAIGRIWRGEARQGQGVFLVKRDGSRSDGRVEALYAFENLKRTPIEHAEAGEIVAIAGMPEVDINDTITSLDKPEPLPGIKVDEPTISMMFSVNDSPLSGLAGRFLTSRHLRDRLYKELRINLALRVEDTDSPDEFKVSGRGLLHLSILIENMRREGFELQVSRPHVIVHEEAGQKLEPVEYVTVDVPEDYSGKVIEMLGARRGMMKAMNNADGAIHFEYFVPARGLIGLRSKLLSATRGEAILYHSFYEYQPYKGDLPERNTGAIVAMEPGEVTSYALSELADRGVFFVVPGDKIYEGMVAGEHCKDADIVANICRKKHLTNMRAASADSTMVLQAPRILSLEEALEYVTDDELVEITPQLIRLRKKLLTQKERKRSVRG